MRSIQTFHSCLQSLENTSASASVANATVSQPALIPQLGLSETSHLHTLASTIPAPLLGRPYISSGASVSPWLRSKIWKAKYIDVISVSFYPLQSAKRKFHQQRRLKTLLNLLIPVEQEMCQLENFLWLSGFTETRSVLVFHDGSIEVDAYLALIRDLHIRYERNRFYQYYKAFSTRGLSTFHDPTSL